MREIEEYGNYFRDFFSALDLDAKKKVNDTVGLLICEKILSKKYVKKIRKGLYELRIQCKGNSYRVFFIFRKNGNVVLLNGFLKKTRKTPENEINKALKLKKKCYLQMQDGNW